MQKYQTDDEILLNKVQRSYIYIKNCILKIKMVLTLSPDISFDIRYLYKMMKEMMKERKWV